MTQTTVCARCGDVNPADARFCIGCGESLVTQATTGPTVKLNGKVCEACGTTNPAEGRFCTSCGRALGGQQARPAATPRPVVPPPAPRVYPRVHMPPTYVPRPSPRPSSQWQGGNGFGPALVLLSVLFIVLSMASARSGFPIFFLFLPLGLLGGLRAMGSSGRQLAPLFWMIGLLFLFATGTFWPGIFLLWLLWMLLGR